MALYRPALEAIGALSLASLGGHRSGRVAIGGLVVTRQHPMTARGTVFLALAVYLALSNWLQSRLTRRRVPA